jgi:hypothetical protein
VATALVIVVTDLAGVDVTASVLDKAPWCGGADLDAGPWLLAYDGYDPDTEGIRETLCTLANGYCGRPSERRSRCAPAPSRSSTWC